MLVVTVIIALLAGMTVGIAHVVFRNKELASTRAEMQQILFLLEEYKMKVGKYPPMTDPNATSLKSPLESVVGKAIVAGKTDFLDPWDEPFLWVRRNNDSCTLYSKGPDTLEGDEDSDIDNVMPTE